jgi:hypothetical protein
MPEEIEALISLKLIQELTNELPAVIVSAVGWVGKPSISAAYAGFPLKLQPSLHVLPMRSMARTINSNGINLAKHFSVKPAKSALRRYSNKIVQSPDSATGQICGLAHIRVRIACSLKQRIDRCRIGNFPQSQRGFLAQVANRIKEQTAQRRHGVALLEPS